MDWGEGGSLARAEEDADWASLAEAGPPDFVEVARTVEVDCRRMPFEFRPIDIGGEFKHLRAAMYGFCNRDERDFSAAEIGEQVIHLSRTLDLGRHELAKLVGVFASTREAEIQGSNNPTDWVRHHARLSRADATALRVVGEHLEDLPQSAAALGEGRVGFGHLVHMAHNAAFIAKSGTGAFDERPLLERAEEESAGRFRETCMSARHVQDPEGYAAAEVNAVEQRELTINPLDDGTTWFNIRLDSAAAAVTQSVLEALSGKLGPDDFRTRPRRMADAFVELTHAPLQEVEGAETIGRHVNINVNCTLESLLKLPGAPAAEVEFGQPISSAVLERLACEANICKILLDENLTPVAVGHMKRTLTKKERRAVNARDRHCQYPSCTRPASRCVPHHMVWYSRGGPTKLSNVILLCAVHHWRMHEGGWSICKTQDGAIHVVPPQVFNRRRGPSGPLAA